MTCYIISNIEESPTDMK